MLFTLVNCKMIYVIHITGARINLLLLVIGFKNDMKNLFFLHFVSSF